MATINFSYADGTTLEQIIAYEVSAKVWEGYLGDDVTVNIHTEVTDQLDPDVMGGALPAFVTVKESYDDDIRLKLINDATTADDTTAITHNLPSSSTFDVYANGADAVTSGDFNVTTANAKAFGLASAHGTQLDGFIAISDLASDPRHDWDYDVSRATTIESDEIDFLSVVLHEVGHVLGFISGIDSPDWLATVQAREEDDGNYEIDDNNSATPLDLFRYSADGLAAGNYGLDWSIAGADPYFSIDGGTTQLADFASGSDVDFVDSQQTDLQGDGFQASHWENNFTNPAGIFDGAITDGVRRDLSNVDLQALDVIGWDRVSPSSSSLQTLYDNVVAGLATQLGQTVTWIEANLTSTVATLTENRMDEVITLIENSEVYEDGWGSGGSSGGCGWCQNFTDLFHQYAFFAELPTSPPADNDPLTGSGNGAVPVAVDESASAAAPMVTGGISGILYAQGAGDSQQTGQGAIAAATQALENTTTPLNTTGSASPNSDTQSLNLAANLAENADGYDVTQLMLTNGDAIMKALVSPDGGTF